MASFYLVDRYKTKVEAGTEFGLRRVRGREEDDESWEAAKALNEEYPDGLSMHGIRHIAGYFDSKPEYLERELLLEEVRKAEFPHAPSRFVSYFACGSLEDAQLLKRAKGPDSQAWRTARVWEVQAADSFRADMNWLGPHFILSDPSMARLYWCQEPSPSPFWEHLLNPPVKLIRLIE